MNYFRNTVSVKLGSLQIEAYKVLVRAYLKILGLYCPVLVRDEDFTRNINKYYLEKGYLRYHKSQVFNALHNNYETLLWKNWRSFTHHARVTCTQKRQDHEYLYPHDSVNQTKIPNPLDQLRL